MRPPEHGMTTRLFELLASEREPDLEEAIAAAMSEGDFRRQLFDSLTSKSDTLRYNCFKVLQEASARDPARFYPLWDDLVSLLDSSNAYHRSVGARLLANLTRADTDCRFEPLMDRYFDLLDDDKIMTARYVVGTVSAIVDSKPHLIPQITAKLLAMDDTHHAEGRKDLLKGDIVEAFDTFIAQVPDRAQVLSFVEAQLRSSSPRTRKAARAFLEKHANAA